MPRTSAGLLLYRRLGGELEVFLVHPGGPFWKSRDLGAWSIPKGEYEAGEDPLAAARREFEEETGFAPPSGAHSLESVKQPGGKIVHAWAAEGDCDPACIESNTFRVELPKGSGKWRSYPEIDRAGWFPLDEARQKILAGQLPFLDRLERFMEGSSTGGTTSE